jgi:hypothetical protein
LQSNRLRKIGSRCIIIQLGEAGAFQAQVPGRVEGSQQQEGAAGKAGSSIKDCMLGYRAYISSLRNRING